MKNNNKKRSMFLFEIIRNLKATTSFAFGARKLISFWGGGPQNEWDFLRSQSCQKDREKKTSQKTGSAWQCIAIKPLHVHFIIIHNYKSGEIW